MNLTLHILRKDFRLHRLSLVAWLAVLVAALCVAVRTGHPDSANTVVSEQAMTSLLHIWLTSLLFLLPLMVSALVVVDDSPANREGFLATRPIPGRQLFLAKLYFLLIAIILPATLTALLSLVCLKLPTQHVLHGTCQLLVSMCLCCALAALVAAHASSPKELFLTVVISLALAWFGIALVTLGIGAVSGIGVSFGNAGENVPLGIFLGVLLLSVSMALGIPSSERRFLRPIVIYVTASAAMVLALFSPWRPFALKDHPLPDQMADLAEETPRLFLQRTSVYPDADNSLTRRARTRISLPFFPLNHLPPNCRVEWSLCDARVQWDSREFTPRDPNPSFFHRWSMHDAQDNRCCAAAMPFHPTLTRPQHSTYFGQDVVALSIPTLPDPDRDVIKVGCSGTLRGRVSGWRKEAELPLTPGAHAGTVDRNFTLDSVDLSTGMPKVGLTIREFFPRFSLDPNRRLSSAWPWDRYVVMLHHPASNALLTASGTSSQGMGTTALIPLSVRHLKLQFSPAEVGLTSGVLMHADSLRLVVFRKHYLGSLRQEWSTGTLTAGTSFIRAGSVAHNSRDQLPRREYLRRLDALTPPDVHAPQQEVAPFVGEVLRLVEARCHNAYGNDPIAQLLAPYVENHLDIFLTGLETAGGAVYSQRLLELAIVRGATESQKQHIVAGLRRNPRVVSIILKRGWTDDARDELFELLNRVGPLPQDAVEALAWFQKPETYPRLIGELQHNPQLQLFEMLRRLPGIEPELSQAVDELWNPGATGDELFDATLTESMAIALRTGRRDTLEAAFRLLRDPRTKARGNYWQVASALHENLLCAGCPDNARGNPQLFAEWLQEIGYAARDVVYDDARRRFVLAATPPKTH